jgi:transposase
MVHYIGLDVSLKQTSICVVDQVGTVVREGVVDSEPEAIAAFVRSKAPGAVRIGLETGPTATWLWSELKQLGLPVICIDARHAKAVLKMQINKSDRNDAAGIARIMQTGWFKEGTSRTSIAIRLGRCWRAGRCWSRSSVMSRTRSGACSRTSVS